MCGVSREMWSKYERGVAVPGGDVWVAFALAGANVQFILTGISSSNVVLSPDESELVQYYRQAPLALKVAAVAALQSGLSNVSSTKQKITGNGNRIAGRDYNEHKK